MRSRALNKCRNLVEVTAERVMEFLHSLHSRCITSRSWKRNIVEQYTIFEPYTQQQFVSEFLNGRARNIMQHNYSMEVKSGEKEEADSIKGEETIGKVKLYRKQQLIDEAMLVIKPADGNNIIYWKFKQRL